MQNCSAALFSLKPLYAESILQGIKKYEFRRTIPKQYIEFILIYASSPVQEILGIARVAGVIRDRPHSLWKIAGDHGGITVKDYRRYFRGKEYGYAIEIKAIYKFEKPILPRTVFREFRPPQSFMYVNNSVMSTILKKAGDENGLCWRDSRRRQNDLL
jgi:predicted transcriptional regulator